MKIETELLRDFAFGGRELEGWKCIARDFVTETRWGVITRIVLSKAGEPDYWAYDFETSSGDGEWCSADDEGEFTELFKVLPQEKTITEYVAV